jgi:predicted small lipoprotein YifL
MPSHRQLLEQSQAMRARIGMFSPRRSAGPRIVSQVVRDLARYTCAKNLSVAIAMPRTLRLTLLVSILSVSLVACGNKGPLVLPDPTPPPPSQNKDKDKDKPATTTQPQSQPDGSSNGRG